MSQPREDTGKPKPRRRKLRAMLIAACVLIAGYGATAKVLARNNKDDLDFLQPFAVQDSSFLLSSNAVDVNFPTVQGWKPEVVKARVLLIRGVDSGYIEQVMRGKFTKAKGWCWAGSLPPSIGSYEPPFFQLRFGEPHGPSPEIGRTITGLQDDYGTSYRSTYVVETTPLTGLQRLWLWFTNLGHDPLQTRVRQSIQQRPYHPIPTVVP